MREVEVAGTIDCEGRLLLDQSFCKDVSRHVRLIVLFSELIQKLDS